ncbi:unnamed protein product [Soboliphyme baturini]|uniref:Uncharacterized protein n=1 Tax=Soboliphyme baturini TaxID=241478 RepID=A0A183IWH2_9BILA|nr:unnamed protein product [Soboliphyme baturini]
MDSETAGAFPWSVEVIPPSRTRSVIKSVDSESDIETDRTVRIGNRRPGASVSVRCDDMRSVDPVSVESVFYVCGGDRALSGTRVKAEGTIVASRQVTLRGEASICHHVAHLPPAGCCSCFTILVRFAVVEHTKELIKYGIALLEFFVCLRQSASGSMTTK